MLLVNSKSNAQVAARSKLALDKRSPASQSVTNRLILQADLNISPFLVHPAVLDFIPNPVRNKFTAAL